MARGRTRYVCAECGAVHPGWMGRCPECGAWNTIEEEAVTEEDSRSMASVTGVAAAPRPVTEGAGETPERLATGLAEFDRVLGGGIVPGSITLVGGDPGIGKSTLMLQVSHRVAMDGGRVLYVSGEESFSQARMRADRLGALDANLLLYTETSMDAVAGQIEKGGWRLVVADSIQSMHTPSMPSAPGSVGQVRECAAEYLRLAKGMQTPVMLVGHVTKDGIIAGPRLLEHMVDTVLYFEGEGRQALRILRAVKNRFGSTNEIGVFEMRETGLHEVADPSALFLGERPKGVSGSAVLPGMEGTRPVLVEVQALVGEPHAGSPRRAVSGVNPGRVSLLLAVLEKRAGLRLCDRDVFVNVAGGVKVDEPAADLAVALAVASSCLERPVREGMAAFGEVGLAGEVRAVDAARQRAAEAAKFGFESCMLPRGCAADAPSGAGAVPVARLTEAIRLGLEG